MTTPHADWPKTLEWIEKQALDSLKSRFTTAETLSKEVQLTLTVLLAGVAGTAAYAVKLFEPESPGPVEIATAIACIYIVALAVILVMSCMMLKKYPALYQEPSNLMHSTFSLDAIREKEIKNIDARIKQATAINATRAAHLNRLRIATALSPLIFALSAALAPPKHSPAVEKTKYNCKVEKPFNGAVAKVECELAK
jgi:hypothetical protein